MVYMANDLHIAQFEQLYRTLFPRLVQFASSYTENEQDAEDIVQQAMLKLWTLLSEERLAELESPRAFLYTMVRNASLDYVKHHTIVMERMVRGMDEPIIESLYQWDMAVSAEQTTIYRELQDEVESLIAAMPERQQEVFRLSREEELKNQEIANRLHISLKAVEKHITASLKYLREHLGYAKFILFILCM